MGSVTKQITARLHELANPEIAAHSRQFFKTGPGQYGEGDLFLGIRVPLIRGVVREFRATGLDDALELLASPFHEARLLALLIMVRIFSSAGDEAARQAVYDSYLDNTGRINNWDLVDCSAEHIVGAHLFMKERAPLYRLARSASLWERRIAIIATFHFIRKGEFDETMRISEMLLHDREDLIHKAVGWMLREVGKREIDREKDFLERHCTSMPRTMLRYAIERFAEEERLSYLKR